MKGKNIGIDRKDRCLKNSAPCLFTFAHCILDKEKCAVGDVEERDWKLPLYCRLRKLREHYFKKQIDKENIKFNRKKHKKTM